MANGRRCVLVARLVESLEFRYTGGLNGPVGPIRAAAMPISWNEIRHNAISFARDWAGASSEIAEKQTFWNEFFAVFGINRRTFASFEEHVRKISGEYGYIDLFWPGMLLVEH